MVDPKDQLLVGILISSSILMIPIQKCIQKFSSDGSVLIVIGHTRKKTYQWWFSDPSEKKQLKILEIFSLPQIATFIPLIKILSAQ